MDRDNTSPSTPAVDIYIAGFPCQSFSNAGLRKGLEDKRGLVFFGCANYIMNKRPRAFILENVKGLLNHEEGDTFEKVMKCLSGIGDGAYEVKHELLNSMEHGVPQSRPRVYIIGIRKDCKRCEFNFPEPLPAVSIETCLDPVERRPTLNDLPPKTNKTAHKNVKQVLKSLKGKGPLKNTYVIDLDASVRFRSVMKDRTMCMTKSRASGFWVTTRGRRMTVDEMLRCQGMERCFKQVVSDRALGAQIGNAMSQNIIERLLIRLLPAAGLVSKEYPLHDRWAAAARKRSASTASSSGPSNKRARQV